MQEENDIDIAAIEQKWQKHWKQHHIFEPQVDPVKQKYFITVPYPYGNSALHIGHGRMNTNADIIARYHRLKGENVLFPMGFHISGTPVLAVADAIARGDQKQIQLTRDAIAQYEPDEEKQNALITSFSDPMHIATFFSSKIEETFDSVGLSIDWTRQFTTGDVAYQKFITWQYTKLDQAGILVQGKYPILYSADDQNAVGEDDIKDGDLDKVSVQEMKYIQFNIKDTDEYLVAATLRPDSLFGATNLYVKPDMQLVKLRVDGVVWIVAKAAQQKIEHQFDHVELISEHIGQDFMDMTVIVPLLNREVPVYPMQYPDEHYGTGIVYSSPADSPHDYMYLFELKFPGKTLNEYDQDPLGLTPITQTFDKKKQEIQYKSGIPAFDKLHKFGIYQVEGNDDKLEQAKEELYKEAHYGAIMINCNEFDGTPLRKNMGANKVKEALEQQKLGGTFYETSRRAQTRSGQPVIVANLHGQWFLDYSSEDVKQKAYSLLDNMQYNPSTLKQTQKGLLTWLEKRPCARKRGLGTPLPQDPQWIIEPLSDSTIYQMFYLIAHAVNNKSIEAKTLDTSFFDYVLLGQGKAPNQIAQQLRKDVEYWKSFDFRFTAAPHMSNHLAFLIYHYALIFPEEYHPKNITIGGLLIKDGHKISKSKGNGIPLIQVGEKYGVDTYRLYVALAATYDAEMDFKDDEINQLQKRFVKWREMMFDALKIKSPAYDDFNDIDKWLISRFYSRAQDYFGFMDELKMREAYVNTLYEFLNEMNYHQRRSSYQHTLGVLRFIFEDYLYLMAPVTPHICEELYSLLKENKSDVKDVISLKSYSTDATQYIRKDLEGIENIGQTLMTSIPAIMQRKNIDSLKSITLVQANDDMFDVFATLAKLLEQTRDFKTIMTTLLKDFGEHKKFIQKFVPKTLSDGLSSTMNKEEEYQYLSSLVAFLEEQYKAEVSIKTAADIPDYKAIPTPGTPGLIIE